MTTSVSERVEQIRAIVCEHLEIEPGELNDSESFVDGYDADSLSLMDVLAALEKAFGISIDQAQFARMTDVDSVYAVVSESASW